MRRIKIRWDEELSCNYFICPFCKCRIEVTEEQTEDCPHVIYAHETVNNLLIGQYPIIQDEAMKILAEKGSGFLDAFDDYIEMNSNVDEENIDTSEDDEDESKPGLETMAEKFIDQGGLSVENLIKLLKCSDIAWIVKDLIVAELNEVSGIGGTQYVLHPTFQCDEPHE